MSEINETTKTFPRTMEEAFPKAHPWHFDPIRGPEPTHDHMEEWFLIGLAWAAGFVTCYVAMTL
jgi:hypothetical protein